MRNYILRFCITAFWVALIAAPSPADPPTPATDSASQGRDQRTRANRQKGVGPSNPTADLVTEFKGKLKGYQQGLLIVTRDDGTEVMVQLPKSLPKLEFIAAAKFEFLTQGIPVRFNGTFSADGLAQSPIAKVELFQPITGNLTGHDRQRFFPGVYPDPNSAKEQAQTGIAKCAVVGSLVGIDASGVMTVQAGRLPVRIPLVPNVAFEIRYNNLSLAQPGDEVSVAGFYNPPDDTQVVADVMTITTDRIYGQPTAEVPKKTRVPRRSRTREEKTTAGAPEEHSPGGETSSDGAGAEVLTEKPKNP